MEESRASRGKTRKKFVLQYETSVRRCTDQRGPFCPRYLEAGGICANQSVKSPKRPERQTKRDSQVAPRKNTTRMRSTKLTQQSSAAGADS